MTNLSKYYEYRPKLKTGDIIAFSGKGRVSEVIKWKTQSEISHVGIVLNNEVSVLGNTVFICESTTLVNQPDAITKELFKGVQIQILSQRLASYDGKAWCYPLLGSVAPDRIIKMQQWLRKIHAERVPYDAAQAIGAGIDFFDRMGLANQPDFSSLFCSELVSEAWRKLGAVCESINPSEMTPNDVTEFERAGHRVPLL